MVSSVIQRTGEKRTAQTMKSVGKKSGDLASGRRSRGVMEWGVMEVVFTRVTEVVFTRVTEVVFTRVTDIVFTRVMKACW